MRSYDEHLISQAGGDGEDNSPRMTTQQLANIQARADVALVHAPYKVVGGRKVVQANNHPDLRPYMLSDNSMPVIAEFIANAPTDIEALLALVREQAAKLEAVREWTAKFQAAQSSDVAKRDNAQFDLGYSAGRRAAGSILRAALESRP